VISIDINGGDICLHFHPDVCLLAAWSHREKSYFCRRVSEDRAISIAAKAMRAGKRVEAFGDDGRTVTL
jgi:hypothetical protein